MQYSEMQHTECARSGASPGAVHGLHDGHCKTGRIGGADAEDAGELQTT